MAREWCLLLRISTSQGAGRSLFLWISLAAADFLTQGVTGGATFFWRDCVSGPVVFRLSVADIDRPRAVTKNGYFFTNTLSTIIFFVAFATALYYSGVMTWVLKKFGGW